MSDLAAFTLHRPRDLDEAVALCAATPGARYLAGGTDLIPNLRRGVGAPPALVDLGRVAALDGLEATPRGLAIGARVTLATLAGAEAVQLGYPALAHAAAAVAGPGHRSVATVGGNLCADTRCVFYNQSEWWRRAQGYCLKHRGEVCHVAPDGNRCSAAYSGDLAPALLVLDASLEIVGPDGPRCTPIAEFYADDGRAHLALAPGELVVRVLVPAPHAGERSGYRKARVRGAMDFPLAGVAAALMLRDGALADLRVALTGTNSRPFLLEGTAALVGRPVDDSLLAALARLVQKQANPMRTTATAANYRRNAAAAAAQRLVRGLALTRES
jgi:4-hydroxybenzoyl-CoA reductase subunit beta